MAEKETKDQAPEQKEEKGESKRQPATESKAAGPSGGKTKEEGHKVSEKREKTENKSKEEEIKESLRKLQEAGYPPMGGGEDPFFSVSQKIKELKGTTDADELQELESLKKQRDRMVADAEARGGLDKEKKQVEYVEKLVQMGNRAEAQEEILRSLEMAKVETEQETEEGKPEAGMREYYLRERELTVLRETSVSPETREKAKKLQEAAEKAMGFNSSPESRAEASEVSSEFEKIMRMGMADRPRARKENELEEEYLEYTRNWVWEKIEKIDRAEIGQSEMVYFREWNDLLQALPVLPSDVMAEVSAWKHIYASNLALEASGNAKNMMETVTGMEDAMLNMVGGEEKTDNRYVEAIRDSLIQLDDRHLEYMAPASGKESPAKRRQEIKDDIAGKVAGKYDFDPAFGKLFVRIADRVWGLSGLKASRDRITYKKDDGTIGYGRDKEIDKKSLEWGGEKAYELYGYKGEGRFWWRRLYKPWEALAQEKVAAFMPQMLDMMVYGKDGGPHDFFTDVAKLNNMKSEEKLTAEDIKNIRWWDLRGRYGVYIDQLVKVSATREQLIAAPDSLLNKPSLEAINKLQAVYENVDDRRRDALPRVFEGWLRTNKKLGLLERFRPRIEKVPVQGPDGKYTKTLTKPDGTTEEVPNYSKFPHIRFYESEVYQSTDRPYRAYDKWSMEDEIENAKRQNLIEPEKAEELKREYCGIDFLWGLVKRKKKDPITGQEYEVPFFPAIGPLRKLNRIMDKTFDYALGGTFAFFGGFLSGLFKEFFGPLFPSGKK